jgi:hypothetical protein
MSGHQPHAQHESPSSGDRPVVRRVGVLLPYGVAMLVGVLLSLLIQALWYTGGNPVRPPDALALPRQVAETVTPTATLTATPPQTRTLTTTPTRTQTLTRTRTLTPTRTPTNGSVQADIAALRADVEQLQTELRSLWSAYYLARAANQIADAEAALRGNDLDEVEQVLVTVGLSLDLAYEQSDEQDKGPISEFRMQVGAIREDVYVRPEDMDLRLRRLRQSMLGLVDEDR